MAWFTSQIGGLCARDHARRRWGRAYGVRNSATMVKLLWRLEQVLQYTPEWAIDIDMKNISLSFIHRSRRNWCTSFLSVVALYPRCPLKERTDVYARAAKHSFTRASIAHYNLPYSTDALSYGNATRVRKPLNEQRNRHEFRLGLAGLTRSRCAGVCVCVSSGNHCTASSHEVSVSKDTR